MKKYGFIGIGNMGGALCSSVCRKVGGENVLISDRSEEKKNEFSEKYGAVVSDNNTIAKKADVIFLGVKPQGIEELLLSLSETLKERKDRFILVSMVAGLPIESVCRMAGDKYPVIRIMPNTPAMIGEGMILYCADESVVEKDELESFVSDMEYCGRLDKIDEKLIDAASALSGCGPAFVYMFIEALADGAVMCGLPRAKALEYACQTLAGSAKLVMESGKHPEELKDAVCSPGGTTIAGVAALEEGAFRSSAINAVKAAYEKTLKLKK